MNGRWLRIGNFYQAHLATRDSRSLRKVVFNNYAESLTILGISVTCYAKGNATIELTLSPCAINEVHSACRQYFSDDELIVSGCAAREIIIKFHSSSLKKLKELFSYLNHEYHREEFTPDIIIEFTRISTFLYDKQKRLSSNRHVIPEETLTHTYANPEEKDASSLVNLIKDSKRRMPIKEYKKCLIRGASINQGRVFGVGLLYYLVADYGVEEIRLALFYGGNFFTRNNGNARISAFELAKLHNKIDILNVIIAAFSNPKKTLKLDDEKEVKIKNVTLSSDSENEIQTCISYTTGKTICTRLTSNKFLSDRQERKELLNLFFQYFSSPKGREHTESIFNRDFVSGDRWIERFYEKEEKGSRLIGFSLYECVMLLRNANNFFLHIVYTAIHPLYRGYGIIDLSLRLVFSLQHLLAEHVVGVIFPAVHYNSYGVLRKLKLNHFPMYQSDTMREKIHEAIHVMYDGEVKFVHDGLTCYVEEEDEIKVIGSYFTRPSDDINQFIFYREILNFEPDTSPKKARSAVCSFLVTDDSFKKLNDEMCQIGFIGFSRHVDWLAGYISTLFKRDIPKVTSRKTTHPYFNDSLLFWKNIPISEKKETIDQPVLLSKL